MVTYRYQASFYWSFSTAFGALDQLRSCLVLNIIVNGCGGWNGQNSAPAPESGAVGQQATALYISGDMGAFYGCGFLGAQDTLYDHNGRHYFEQCYIQGSIDFIYGDGKSLYKVRNLTISRDTYSIQQLGRLKYETFGHVIHEGRKFPALPCIQPSQCKAFRWLLKLIKIRALSRTR
jgi:hypothetical protein